MINKESLETTIPGYVTLTAENFLTDSYRSKGPMDILCDCNTVNCCLQVRGSVFTVNYFNSKEVHFQLVDPYGVVVPVGSLNAGAETTIWTLTMIMTPLE